MRWGALEDQCENRSFFIDCDEGLGETLGRGRGGPAAGQAIARAHQGAGAG